MSSSIIGVIVILVMPMIIAFKKSMGSGGAAARTGNFSQEFCKMTGLTAGTDSFTGSYKGYQFRVKSEMGTDYAQLPALLGKWYYADIRVHGDTVELTLDHENAPRHFGTRMASPRYWVEAMDICARIADAAKA